MTAVEFEFARYVALRKGAVEQRAREGAAYAFSGARKVRRTLGSARPVALAIEATSRLWQSRARRELLDGAVRVTDEDEPRVAAATERAAVALGLARPTVYLAEAAAHPARTLGSDDAPCVVLDRGAVARLDDAELVSLIGHECGHIQNNHVPYITALYYLRHDATNFVRWIVQPAIMTLQAWSRRAEITCDRAALIATRRLDVTYHAMMKLELELENAPAMTIDDYLAQLPDKGAGLGRYSELFRSHPLLPKRVQALKLFAGSAFYHRVLGEDPTGRPSADDVDRRVAELLSVF
jgi:Zn-dependent protease with chaperone function